MKQKLVAGRLVSVSRLGTVAESGPNADWPRVLTELYEERLVDLVRVCYLITGVQSVAEDLTHDAFVASALMMDQVEKPYPYLRVAVVNRARSWHRHNRVERQKRPLLPEPTCNEPDEMWDALERLNDRQRAAIVLRFYDGVSDREIAQILKCAQPTVRTLVRRGLKQLRRELEQ